MPVKISPRARKFLQDKGVDTIFLHFVDIAVADNVGVVKEVEVYYGQPDRPDLYWLRHADGIKVYVDRRLDSTGTVEIKKQGFWKFANLYADGLRIPL